VEGGGWSAEGGACLILRVLLACAFAREARGSDGRGLLLPRLLLLLLLAALLVALLSFLLLVTLALALLVLGDHVFAAGKVLDGLVGVGLRLEAHPLDLVLGSRLATADVLDPLADDLLWLVRLVCTRSCVEAALWRAPVRAFALRWQRLRRRARRDLLL
jgi:hypothetical protein